MAKTIESQFDFITAVALNRTLNLIRDELKTEMKTVFNNPTPYTMRGIFIKYAKKKELDKGAIIKVNDAAGKGTPQSKYLMAQVYGGKRREKRSEMWLRDAGILPAGMFTVPGKAAPLDQFGNLRGGWVTRLLSVLAAHPDAYSRTTDTSAKRNKAVGKMRQSTFVVKEKGKRHPGIYQRKGNSVEPMLMFVREPRYEKRFKFFEVIERVYNDSISSEFDKAFNQYWGK